MHGTARSAQIRAHTSMICCFSSASSAVDSPVVPSGTSPAAPASSISYASRSTASIATDAVRRERRDERERTRLGAAGRPSGEATFATYVSDLAVIVLTTIAGFLAGVLSGMFGVGGAVISTPAIRALGATPLDAVGSTMPAVIPSAISGALRYHREGLLQLRVVAVTAGVGIVASVGGALLTDSIPGDGHVLMLFTAVLVGFSAIQLGRRPPTVARDRRPMSCSPRARPTPAPARSRRTRGTVRDAGWRLAVIGVAAGGMSGLLGVGGGIVMVPLFTAWIRLPLKQALGTSLACVGVLAVPGTITHAPLGNIDWLYALPLCVGVVPGARIGAHLAIRSSDRRCVSLVAGMLGTIALAYGVGEILGAFV